MRTRIFIGSFISILLAFLVTIPESCYRKFYKVADNPHAENIDSTIQLQNQKQKFFILRSGGDAFHMENVSMDNNSQSLTFTLRRLPPEHQLYLAVNKKSGIPFKQSKQYALLNEVHIYTLQDSQFQFDSNYTLSINKISKIEILEKDKGRTTTSTIVSTVGIALTVGAIIAIISSSSNHSEPPPPSDPPGSCPFVSAYNGEEFLTQGELYAGSVYPQLARNDYLPLTMEPVSEGRLQLKISNEQQEIQHTDLAELMVITHAKNVEMMVDENGKPYSVSKPVQPFAATSNEKDILNVVAKQDDLVYAYDDTSENAHSKSVQLLFNKESNSKKANLIFTIRNSFWIDYILNKMMEGYGVYYPRFVKKQQQRPAAQLQSWMKAQKIPLTVSMLTADGWQKITEILPVGPQSFRKTVVTVDLENIPGNTIHVQLSCGFMFWELDNAAIDFTEDENYVIEKLLPSKAVDENGKDVTAQLSADDKNYLVQPRIGNITTVEYVYNTIPSPDKTQTYVLHSKGFYEYVRDYKNKPDVKFLKQFKHAGALSDYSMVLYKQMVNGNRSNMVKK